MKKLDISRLSFNDVKDGIFGKLAREREEKVVKEYFEKLKSRATIDIIRLPN
jgi:hypothetical protein